MSEEELEIVAEAAEGYGSDWGKELALVDLASAGGATALKLQLLHADELLVMDHPLRGFVASLEMEPKRWRAVAERCREREIALFLDVFGERGVDLAVEVGAAALKVHSSDMLNRTLLDKLAQCPVERLLLSAGGTTLDELEGAIKRLADKDLTVIQGFQAYPTEPPDARIGRLDAIRERYPSVCLGYADHTGFADPVGMWLPALALAFGAGYIEKHITVAQVLEDADHQSALTPDQFAEFVYNIRAAESALALPQGADCFSEAERTYRLKMKKHVVATRSLHSGAEITAGDVTLRRCHEPPADVMFDTEAAVGRRLTVDLAVEQPVRSSHLA